MSQGPARCSRKQTLQRLTGGKRAMVKRKKLPRKAHAAATAAEAKAAAAPNMFERLHSRKKFSVLGKRAKGEQRATGKLRSEAVERVREHTTHSAERWAGCADKLGHLVSWGRSARRRCSWSISSCARQTRTLTGALEVGAPSLSSVAACKVACCGWPERCRAAAEDDDTLTAEEKAVARFQKERMKALGGALAACFAGCRSKGTPRLCLLQTGHAVQQPRGSGQCMASACVVLQNAVLLQNAVFIFPCALL